MKIKLLLVSSLCTITSALAQPIPVEEFPLNGLLADALEPILSKVGIFVGGIFSLYFILTLIQILNERKKVRLLKDIRNDVDLLALHFGVKHSHEKRGIFRRIFKMFQRGNTEPAKKNKK